MFSLYLFSLTLYLFSLTLYLFYQKSSKINTSYQPPTPVLPSIFLCFTLYLFYHSLFLFNVFTLYLSSFTLYLFY